jgi:hypothetical protein
VIPFIAKRIIGLLVLGFAAAAWTTTGVADVPALYFYPPPAIMADGTRAWTPLTLNAEQITTQFPVIQEMSGVSLLIDWNQIEPQHDQFDFSIIDRALAYWGAKGKKVILGVGTVGFPFRNAAGSLDSATPDWVLHEISTFQQDSMVLPWSPVPAKNHTLATMPSYWDPKFVDETRRLVEKLAARYDGNPALAYVRIGTGMLGEDNATLDGLKATMPGWSKLNWVHYCQQMADIYAGAFHRSQLEFDEGWIPIIEAIGTPAEQAAARAFSKSLNDRHVFRAFNGLESQDFSIWQQGDAPTVTLWHRCILTDLRELKAAKEAGCGIGLESGTFRETLWDVDAIANVVKAIEPDRLVLFNDVPSLLRHDREGGPPGADLLQEVPAPAIAPETARVKELFRLLGYPNR